jgi:hypothetical protein
MGSAARTSICELHRIVFPTAYRADHINSIQVFVYSPKSTGWTREAHGYAERSR